MSPFFRILVINPGSTSTKVAIFDGKKEHFMSSISHPDEELHQFSCISEQHEFRVRVIEEALAKNNIDINSVNGVVGRGGLLHPIPSGTYEVNKKMLFDLEKAEWGEHASNLGGIIAHDIAMELGIRAFIVDPVVVDEMDAVAKITGVPELERRSIFHALNHKAIARRTAEELEKPYEELSLIVAHLGGGISIGVHKNGKVIDVNNAFDGDGPFAPERAGGLPVGQVVDICFSGIYTKDEIKRKLVGGGGVVAYLGTKDMRKANENYLKGDEETRLIYEAMAYQVAKEIGACATVLKGQVDGIVLSGGLTYDDEFIGLLKDRIRWIGHIFISHGEKEMQALAYGALRVLQGKEKAKVYK